MIGQDFLQRIGAACLAMLLIAIAPATAFAADEDAKRIADRYLTVLLKRPRLGTALDRVYAFHLQNNSLSELLESLPKGEGEDAGNRQMVCGLIELHRGNAEAASEHLASAEQTLTADAMCSYYLALALEQLGKPEQATDALERSVDRNPARSEALPVFKRLARLYDQAEKRDKTLGVWQRLEDYFPGDVRVGAQIAQYLAEDGHHLEAFERYEALAKRTRKDSEKIEFAIQAAEMRRQLGDREHALADLEALLTRVRPGSWLHEDLTARIERGFLESGDYSGLADYYAKRLEKQAGDLATLVRLGRVLMLAGRLKEAELRLSEAVELAPRDQATRLALVDVLQQSFRFVDAAEQFEILAEQDPENPDYLIRWGGLLLQQPSVPLETRRTQAAAVWKRLADAKSDDPVTVALVADKLRSIDLIDDAVEQYRRAIELAPDQPQFREYLGDYFHKLGRVDEAIETWRSMAEEPRRGRESLVRLAEVFAAFAQPELSLEAWEQAAGFDLSFEQQLQYAKALAKSKRYDDAINRLDEASELAETDDERDRLFAEQIETYQQQGTLEVQIEAMRQAAPDAENLRKLAIMQRTAGRLSDAAVSIRRALDESPDDVSILIVSADLSEQQNRLGDAADTFSRLASVDRRYRPNHLKRVAELQISLGQFEAALKTADELIEASPASPESYQFLASVAFRARRDELALSTLRRGIQVAPRDNVARIALAAALSDRFRTDEAIELYWEALRNETEAEQRLQAVEKLAELYQRQGRIPQLVLRVENLGRDIGNRRLAGLMVARVYESRRDYGLAREAIKKLLSRQPNDPSLLASAVRLARIAEEPEEALDLQQRLTDLADTTENRSLLLQLKVDAGKLSSEEAFELQLDAIREPVELGKLARITFRRGENARTIQVCRELLRRDDSLWDVKWLLASTLLNDAENFTALPSEGMDLCRELLDAKYAWDAKPPTFAPQQDADADANGSIHPERWPADTIQMVTPANQRRFGVRVISGSWTRGSSRSTTARTWIQFDSFSHAQTLAAALLLHHSSKSVPQTARGAKYLEAWEAYASVEDIDEIDRPDLIWRQLALGELGSHLGMLPNQLELQAQATWRLAELAPVAAGERLLTSLYSRGVFHLPERGRAPEFSLPPLSFRQLETLRNVFMAQYNAHRVPGQTYAKQSLRYRAPLVMELRRAGQLKVAEQYDVTLEEDFSFNDLALATDFLLYTGEESRADEAMRRLLPALRRTPYGKRDPNFEMLTQFHLLFTRPNDLPSFLKKHEAMMLDLLFVSRGGQPAFSSSSTYRASSPSAAPVRISASVGHRLSLAPYYGVANFSGTSLGSISLPLSSRLFGSDLVGRINRLSAVMKGTKTDPSTLPASFIEHLETDAPGMEQDERIRRRVFAAYAQWWRKNPRQCYDDLVKIGKEFPDNLDLQFEIARLAQVNGMPAESIRILEACDPADGELIVRKQLAMFSLSAQLGDVLRAKGAAEALNEMRLDPGTRFSLAEQARRLGLSRQADEIIRQMPAGRKLTEADHLRLANTLMDGGETEAASEVAYSLYQRLSRQVGKRRDPNREQMLRKVIQLLVSTGRFESMIDDAIKKVQSAPASVDNRVFLARLYEAAGRNNDAEAEWLELSRMQNVGARELLSRAQTLKNGSRNAEAANLYLRLIDESPAEFGQHYYDIVRTVQKAKRVERLYQVLAAMPPSLIPAYRIDELIRLEPTMTSAKRAMIRNAVASRNVFPYLHEVINALPAASVATISEIHDMVTAAVTSNDAFKADSSLWRVSSRSSDGTANGPLKAILSLAHQQSGVGDSMREAIEQAKSDPAKQPTAEILEALLNVEQGQDVAASSEVVFGWAQKQIELQKQSKPIVVSGGLLWQAGQLLASERRVADRNRMAVSIYEAAKCDPKVTSGSDPRFGIFHRLVDAYAADGQGSRSRRMILDAYHRGNQTIFNRSTSVSDDYRRLKANQWYGDKLMELNLPIDAAMIYRREVASPKQFERVKVYGTTVGLKRFLSRLETIEDEVNTNAAIKYLDQIAYDVGIADQRPAIPLLDVPTATLIRVPNHSRFASALQLATRTPGGADKIAELDETLEQAQPNHPTDWTIPAARLLIALATEPGSAEPLLPALMKCIPDDAEFGRANSDTELRNRLRELFGLYTVANVAMQSESESDLRVGAAILPILRKISLHAKRPGMSVAVAVLTAGSDGVDTILTALESDRASGGTPTLEQINECLDIATHAAESIEDFLLATRAVEAALGSGPPLLDVRRSVDPFGRNPLALSSTSTVQKSESEMATLNFRVSKIAGAFRWAIRGDIERAKFPEILIADQAAIYECLTAIVIPEQRSGVVFPYQPNGITRFHADPAADHLPVSAASVLCEAARRTDKVDELLGRLRERLADDVAIESIAEIMIQLAIETEDEALLGEALATFAESVDRRLPDVSAEQVVPTPGADISLMSVPPDSARKAMLIDQMCRVLWPIAESENADAVAPLLSQLLVRTENLMASDTYTRLKYDIAFKAAEELRASLARE